jgi:hypothetical protein
MEQPRFLRQKDREKFNVQKAMATPKETDHHFDPDAHK